MRWGVLLSVPALTLLSACAVPGPQYESSPTIVTALETRPDGYSGVVPETGQRFQIVSTRASDTRLCRVVAIDSGDRFEVESFCKTKGGAWT